MLMDVTGSAGGGKSGKHVKYKVGFHGKNAEPDVYQAQGENDSVLQNSETEQQNLKAFASHAKAEGETQFASDGDKRQKAAEVKLQKKAQKKQNKTRRSG